MSVYLPWRQRLARNKRKRTEKRKLEKNAVQELKQEKYKRKAAKEKLLYTEKKKDKFYQMWRQTEREKEKSHQSQMSLEKKSSDDCSKGVVPIKTLLDIPGEILNFDCRIQMLPWEKESLAK